MNYSQKIQMLIIVLLMIIFSNYQAAYGAQDIEEIKESVVKIAVIDQGGGIETGTGIILKIKDHKAYILTAFHVIQNYKEIKVTLYKQPTLIYPATVFQKYDSANDLAIIRIDDVEQADSKSGFRLGDVDDVKETDEIIAIGHPTDHDWEVSKGNIFKPEPTQFRFSGSAIDPGNSGGPLLNSDHHLIGIVTQKLTDKYSYAVKIDHALKILDGWGVPYAFMRDWKWYYIGGGSVTAAAILAAIFWPKDDGKTLPEDNKLPDPPPAP
ncbi:trypsin-like peptidase domain-containing protein [candidate division KSB1 bacterium]|nr:trypsin-like peptidase domain-containing protein [candidate division KSB1 bacterium]